VSTGPSRQVLQAVSWPPGKRRDGRSAASTGVAATRLASASPPAPPRR
jgi:hypothetical protein